ncbi:FAD-binding oxidoreductase [Aquamicrobium sp. LC103]|uniref:NAD(P)/FAD-dependent oxidoreductase n=1 Tax=Aquamicrobium sp. LC103 TaxID=1120658 RepID=UPI00063EABF1|nr:FAD-binding oxidoreductase [Aquamicrobium sp. LC103]TKT82503.1 FAD-binding oxidoreductase [Aquamicrobium sp. LC103]
MSDHDYDFAVIGGGFYGLFLALFLRGISDRVVVFEAEEEAFSRASRVNQARVHTGFHYPRNFVTAMRSLSLHQRFARDFPDAIVDDFDMLYAVASRRSKVSAGRFRRMYEHLEAPIQPAPRHLSKLFDETLIEGVFRVREWAFDYRALRRGLLARLDAARIPLRLGTKVERIESLTEGVGLELSDGTHVKAGMAFNVTYAGINALLLSSGLAPLPLKHEFVELALVEPPEEMKGLAVTVMDGPFFSFMPYPAAGGAYSLTHVRYTPHWSWSDAEGGASMFLGDMPHQSRWRHMKQDARRYVPCLDGLAWRESLFDIKTVPIRNELNDGRPILLHRHADAPRLLSVLGGKIDNIYDLFSILPAIDARFASARLEGILEGKNAG